jgi:exodeoxyribonuclease VII small subunit
VETDKLTKLTFEAALDRLEGLVDSMEQGEVPLAELLAKYEEGTKLLKDGAVATEPFEPARPE